MHFHDQCRTLSRILSTSCDILEKEKELYAIGKRQTVFRATFLISPRDVRVKNGHRTRLQGSKCASCGEKRLLVPAEPTWTFFEFLSQFPATLYSSLLNERSAHSNATCCFCAALTILVNIRGIKMSTITTGFSCFRRPVRSPKWPFELPSRHAKIPHSHIHFSTRCTYVTGKTVHIS